MSATRSLTTDELLLLELFNQPLTQQQLARWMVAMDGWIVDAALRRQTVAAHSVEIDGVVGGLNHGRLRRRCRRRSRC